MSVALAKALQALREIELIETSQIELQATATHIQWREVGGEWQNLIALSELEGPEGPEGPAGPEGPQGPAGADGSNPEFQSSATHLQWRLEGETEWTNLVSLEEIGGTGFPDLVDGQSSIDESPFVLGRFLTLRAFRWDEAVVKVDSGPTGAGKISITLNGTEEATIDFDAEATEPTTTGFPLEVWVGAVVEISAIDLQGLEGLAYGLKGVYDATIEEPEEPVEPELSAQYNMDGWQNPWLDSSNTHSDTNAWTTKNAIVEANQSADRFGNTTMDKFVPDDADTDHRLANFFSPPENTIIVLIADLKAAEMDRVIIELRKWDNNFGSARFDLTGSGSVISDSGVSSSGIDSVGDGIYRAWIRASTNAGSQQPEWRYKALSGSQVIFAGNNVNGVYVAYAGAMASPDGELAPVFETTDRLSTPDSVATNDMTLPRNDMWTSQGLEFNGIDDSVSGLPALPSAHTIVWSDGVNTYGIDSDGGSFVNGSAQAGQTNPGIRTSGEYDGLLAWYEEWNGVLSSQAHSDRHTAIVSALNDRPGINIT